MKSNTIEVVVGLFMVFGFGALVYLALQLGEVPFLTQGKTYVIKAEFDNVSGVKNGASVQVAGVVVGSVSDIALGHGEVAVLSLRVDRELEIPTDSIASVRSQGIIGDKYIQLSIGADSELMQEGGVLVDTESSVDIESLISKFAFGSAK